MTHSWVLLSLPNEISEPRGGIGDPDIVSDCLFHVSIWIHNRDFTVNWPWNKLWYISNAKSALAAAIPISVNSNSYPSSSWEGKLPGTLDCFPPTQIHYVGKSCWLISKTKTFGFPFTVPTVTTDSGLYLLSGLLPRLYHSLFSIQQSVRVTLLKRNMYYVFPSLTILQKYWKSKLPPLPYRPCVIWPLHFLSDLISHLSHPCLLSSFLKILIHNRQTSG